MEDTVLVNYAPNTAGSMRFQIENPKPALSKIEGQSSKLI